MEERGWQHFNDTGLHEARKTSPFRVNGPSPTVKKENVFLPFKDRASHLVYLESASS